MGVVRVFLRVKYLIVIVLPAALRDRHAVLEIHAVQD